MKYCFYAIGAIFCWASLPVATGSGLDEFSTEELMFYSFTSATVFLYIQDILINRSAKIHLPGWRVSLMGIWGIFLYHYVYYQALDLVPLAEGAILATTWSFWIVVFSSFFIFRRLKLSILLIAFVGLCGAGMVIAAGKELSFDLVYMQGYLLALLCGLIWSSFSVGLSRMKRETNHEPMTAFTLYAALLSAVLFILTMPHEVPSTAGLFSAVYLGCVPLGLSFFLWNRAMNGGNLMVIGFLSYFTPPLAVFLVAVIKKEAVSGQVLLGMVLILAASIVGKLVLDRSQKQV